MENLLDEEMPPSWMWCHEDELTEWFDEVTRKRDEKYGKTSTDETVPMTTNEFAQGRGR